MHLLLCFIICQSKYPLQREVEAVWQIWHAVVGVAQPRPTVTQIVTDTAKFPLHASLNKEAAIEGRLILNCDEQVATGGDIVSATQSDRYTSFKLFMAALCNSAGHIYFFYPVVSSFFLLFLFPHLISAVGHCMSTILPHMMWP